MSLVLTPELEELVKQKVESGEYNTPEDVVQEAFRLLLERERDDLAGLREAIQIGLDDFARGDFEEVDSESTPALVDHVMARTRTHMSQER